MEIITDKLKITLKSTIDFSKFNFAACGEANPGQISISQSVVLEPINSDNSGSPPLPNPGPHPRPRPHPHQLDHDLDSDSDDEVSEVTLAAIHGASSPPVPNPPFPVPPHGQPFPHPVFPVHPGQGNGPKPKKN